MFRSLAMDPSLHILKHVLQVKKSLNRDNIYKLYLCLKKEHTCLILPF